MYLCIKTFLSIFKEKILLQILAQIFSCQMNRLHSIQKPCNVYSCLCLPHERQASSTTSGGLVYLYTVNKESNLEPTCSCIDIPIYSLSIYSHLEYNIALYLPLYRSPYAKRVQILTKRTESGVIRALQGKGRQVYSLQQQSCAEGCWVCFFIC